MMFAITIMKITATIAVVVQLIISLNGEPGIGFVLGILIAIEGRCLAEISRTIETKCKGGNEQ